MSDHGNDRDEGPGGEDGADTSVSILVVDDHEMVADVLSQALEGVPGFEVVGRAGSVAEACTLAERMAPRVVVMDYRLPDGTGVDAVASIRAILPDTDLVLLTGEATSAVLAEALGAGCTAMVRKESGIADLVAAIEHAVAGRVTVPDDLLHGLALHVRSTTHSPGADLTERELEVLSLLAGGRSTQDLVDELNISVHTVRNHVRAILAKLEAHSRLEAVATALRAGLIPTRSD